MKSLKHYVFLMVSCSLFLTLSFAQESAQQFSEAIEDNSYFIEEAYNQEAGVVQHILTGLKLPGDRNDYDFSFTQEWPFLSQTHQLSYTIPFSSIHDPSSSGIGDIQLHYRYQWFGHDDWAAVSPRITLILPTGDKDKGFGSGSSGIQFNLPISKRLSEPFIIHANIGFTTIFAAEGTDFFGNTVKHSLTSFTTGVSGIWLATEQCNIMLEILENFSSEIDEAGTVVHSSETILSPGFRYAVDVGSLQIVPGIAVPISVSDGHSESGVFFYLSFEHPF